MKLWQHSLITIPGALTFYGLTKSVPGTVWFCLTNIFVDLDHFVDYIWTEGIDKFSIKKFFTKFETGQTTVMCVPLHSLELSVLLLLITPFWSWYTLPWLLGGILGYELHMVSDIFGNSVYKKSYFFTYRVWYGFDAKKCLIFSQK